MKNTDTVKTRVHEVLSQADPTKIENYLWLSHRQPRDEDRYQLRLRIVEQGMTAYRAAKDLFGTGLSNRASFDGLYYIARQVEDDIMEFFEASTAVSLAHQVCGYDEVILGLKDLPDVRRIMEICREGGVETEATITIRRTPP